MGVTIKDIARYVGVSYSTVAKALNDSPLVKLQTKQKILQAAEQLGYRPNIAAKMLVTKRTGIIGVVWPSVEKIALSSMLMEIQRELQAKKYTMLLSVHQEREAIQLFEQLRVDAILMFERETKVEESIQISGSIPILSIGRPERMALSSIDVKRRESIRLAVSKLAERGYRRLAYIGYFQGAAQQSDKHMGFLDGIMEYGLPFESGYMINTEKSDWEEGYLAAKRLLQTDHRPEAIVSGGYDLTTGILRALQESQIRIPEDMALISYDNIPQMKQLQIPVSAVGVPVERLAEAVADTLAEIIRNPGRPLTVTSLTAEYAGRASDNSFSQNV